MPDQLSGGTWSRHSAIAIAAILASLVRPRQGCSRGTWCAMIHSPSLPMKRVSVGLLILARMAAQAAGAERPTLVTRPVLLIAMGWAGIFGPH